MPGPRPHALVLQQPALALQPAAVFDQRTVGADQAVAGHDDAIGIGPLAWPTARSISGFAASAVAPRGPGGSRSRGVGAVLVGLFGISPGVMFESCQARRDEGEIICPGNQNTEIEQFKPRLQWVPCRHDDCLLATIDHGRPEAAFPTPPIPCFGSALKAANNEVQACFRHINCQMCNSAIAGLRA